MTNLSHENIDYGVYAGVASGLFSLFCMIFFMISLLASPKKGAVAGLDKSEEIAGYIQKGAAAFLRTEYFYISLFVAFVFIVISVAPYMSEGVDVDHGWKTAVSFLAGSFLSATAGYLGMFTAVRANVRTTAAAVNGLNAALKVAFKSGTVMGLTVVGFGLVGLSIDLYVFLDPTVVAGFGFGASSIALFARVGGGIFTKAADVGADLVGKVANDLNEDDPRNPAVIADNVGDNVGDVAGMGADLFESYVGSIIACLTLAQGLATSNEELTGYCLFPFLVSGGGVVCSIIGTFFVSVKEKGTMNDLLWALRRGLFVASFLVIVWTAVVCKYLVYYGYWLSKEAFSIFGCVIIGLVAGIIIGTATEYATSFEYYPTQSIAHSGHHGHAPVIIQGMGVGMLSTVIPVIVVVISILSCTSLSGLYGIAIAGVGMLSTLGITLATDAYGPVADNAGGIAEMSELPAYVRENTDALDALGNTTAATGKGFAIGSAVLTAVALMASFLFASQIPQGEEVDIMDGVVIPGLLIGAMLPFVFAALTMLSVRRGAHSIMDEVKDQFAKRAAVMARNGDGTDRGWSPDYTRCVAIATSASVLEMIIPGSMAVFCPLIIGFLLGAKALAGMLIGAIGAGFLLAVTMANAGGAWDNAKKYVEGHPKSQTHLGGKGTDLHKATIAGDTVGDPFKDTAGPSLDILLKLMSVVSLVIVQPIVNHKWYQGVIAIGVSILICGIVMYIRSRYKMPTSRELLMDVNARE